MISFASTIPYLLKSNFAIFFTIKISVIYSVIKLFTRPKTRYKNIYNFGDTKRIKEKFL